MGYHTSSIVVYLNVTPGRIHDLYEVPVIFNKQPSFYVTSGGTDGRGTALQDGRVRVGFPKKSLEFFIDVIFPAALWPWCRPRL
jgi:hypothetical protein